MSPVLLVLISGILYSTLAMNRLRNFTTTQAVKSVNWTDAKNECNKMNQSLVTVYDKEDIGFVHGLNVDNLWLGLHRSPHNVSTWSDGVPFTFNRSSVTVNDREQKCEAIDNNTWKGFNCSDRKYFMCHKGSNYNLIENKMNWCQARHYCRKHFTDLVSINDTAQNDQVIAEGKNRTFWIGLMHDQWKWEDNGCSTYREWNNDASGSCTQETGSMLYVQQCTNNGAIICSTGAVRIRVVKQSSTWEQAFDYCSAHHSRLLQIEDEQDQESVEHWLNTTKNANNTFWIGLRQSRIFGFWIWSDKAVLYDNWENDNTTPEMPMSDNCGVIKTDNYRWSDENCLHPHWFLCEEDILYM